MAEIYPSDAELNALSGTTDSEQEVLYVTTGESPYYTSFYKMLQRLLKVARRAGDLRVFKDGDLTFGVRAGRYFNGDTAVNYSQVLAQSLTNNATNYIYLTAAGVLTVNTTGFPAPSVTPHIPLATIITSAGAYDGRDASEGGDITDYRGRGFLTVCGANTGGLNALDWQESVADELDFTSAEPAAPTLGDRYLNTGSGASSETGQTVAANDIEQWNGTSWTEITPTEGASCMVEDRNMLILFNGAAWVDIGTAALLNEAKAFFAATDITGAEAEELTNGSETIKHIHGVAGLTAAIKNLISNLNITAGDEAANKRTITIQVRDAANNNLEERFLVRVWISDAEYIAPDATGNTVAVETGTTYETEIANAAYKIISELDGEIAIGITIAGAATRYIMAEIDGRTYSSGQVDWAA